MKILDLTAGNRAVWFNRNHPAAVYLDIRPGVEPSLVGDARALPSEVGHGYSLVVFDPPHKNNGASGRMTKNYGHFTASEIESLIRGAAAEAWRVTLPGALMAFKWNDHSRRLSDVLAWFAPHWEPLFGHGVSPQQRASQTYWVMLLRSGEARAVIGGLRHVAASIACEPAVEVD